RTGIDLVREQHDGDRRWFARFGDKPMGDRGDWRFQQRWSQRSPLVQQQHRASVDLADKRGERDRRRLARIGGEPVAGARDERGLIRGIVPRSAPSKLEFVPAMKFTLFGAIEYAPWSSFRR